ncbi:M20/M25/M40 family metallo-hydrolase [Paenisporosarcina sp. TG20]|uniref:M20/M25/M40 family metallo-hydrolase n=1 Tax=Paenisporosarcina sp. TG20 TaxID=1211706 RepID=UPI0002D834C7|nr:M20/M25/M40 family metallo-hydrolase [Paenisporosarcina sp. TG20]
MKNTKWQSLFTGFGFNVKEEEMHFNVGAMNKENIKLLETILKQLNASFMINRTELQIFSSPVTVGEWVQVQEQLTDGRTELLRQYDVLPISQLDIYIAGLVTQFNELGFATKYSCDGHSSSNPIIDFTSKMQARNAHKVCENIHLPAILNWGTGLTFQVTRETLPAFAEKLFNITKEEAQKMIQLDSPFMPKEEYYSQLETLLNIPGASRNEGDIRKIVREHLTPYVDRISVDDAGNLLAIRKYGPGPTVLLNAHLDTVEEINPNRSILKCDQIWTSSEGILGADDRAGINVLLSIAKTLTKKQFNGTIKYIFTVEEEIGLRGARALHESFLWDVDMAFVVDRRNTSDIVISRGDTTRFCSIEFARAVERVARLEEFGQWKTTPGGSSDTAIWASHGIQSVNLSAGYDNEHTDMEQLDVEANYETYEFLMALIRNASRLIQRGVRQRVV